MAKKDKERLLTPLFRLNFPHAFERQKNDDGTPGKFNICMMFPKGTDLSKLEDMAKREIKKKWPNGYPKKNFRWPFNKGNDISDDYPECANMILINPNSDYAPEVVDRSEDAIGADELYSGCWCRATVTCFTYDKKSNGVHFGLGNIMKFKDDDKLGGSGRSAADDFEEIKGLDDDLSGDDEFGDLGLDDDSTDEFADLDL